MSELINQPPNNQPEQSGSADYVGKHLPEPAEVHAIMPAGDLIIAKPGTERYLEISGLYSRVAAFLDGTASGAVCVEIYDGQGSSYTLGASYGGEGLSHDSSVRPVEVFVARSEDPISYQLEPGMLLIKAGIQTTDQTNVFFPVHDRDPEVTEFRRDAIVVGLGQFVDELHQAKRTPARVEAFRPRRWAVVGLGASVLAASVAAGLAVRQDDMTYRQGITAKELGLPVGRQAKLDEQTYPRPIGLGSDSFGFYGLKGAAEYIDATDAFIKPRDDESLTPADGLRMVRLAVTGQCERVPLEGQYSPDSHQVLGWTDFVGADGKSLHKYVTLEINKAAPGQYSLNVCSKIAPGVLDPDLSGVSNYPLQESVEVLVDVVPD